MGSGAKRKQTLTVNARWVLPVLACAVALVAGSCRSGNNARSGNGDSQAKRSPDGSIDEVDILSVPHAKQVFHLMRGEKGFVLADIAPERKTLEGLTRRARKEYLIKRSLVLAAEAAAREKFADRDALIVRMLLVKQTNEYNVANWEAASEIAWIEVKKSSVAGLSALAINAMKPQAAEELLDVQRLNLEPLSGAGS